MTTPEGAVQKYGQEQLKKRGCLVRKISYEGRRGCPDHLVLVPYRELVWSGGVEKYKPCVIFVEYKRDETTEPDPHQVREHERIRQHGGDVRVIGSRQQVDELIEEFFPE
jgi:hypothetical protein